MIEESNFKQNNLFKLIQHPAFFTLQDHRESRIKQINAWSEIIHSHLKSAKILDTSISQLLQLPILADNSTAITKRLDRDELREILDFMADLNLIEWKTEENLSVNWTSPFELADAIYDWAKKMKLIGYTETLKGISQGDMTDRNLKFHDLPQAQILKACEILENSGRADVFEVDGIFSVKFK